MEEAPLLGAMSGPDDEMVTDLFCPERPLVPEGLALSPAVGVKLEQDELPVLGDAYLGAADPAEPLLRALSPPPGAHCPGEVQAALLGDFPGLPELRAPEDAAPPAYSVHVLSSLLPAPRGPALVPLGAGVRVIPVEIKEGGGSVASDNPEEAAFQSPLAQESFCTFLSSQEAEDTPGCSRKKDSGPMVICQLKGGAQMLCIEHSGTRELKALHLVPQHQDQNNYLQSDVPKPMTTLVGRFLPVPAKLNLIAQQLDSGARPSAVTGPAFPTGSALPGPPKIALAGYCDCFASGDFCNNCNCNNCCNNLRHEIERFKAIKAKIMCSSICKCVGCKNYEESPERKTLTNMPSYVEMADLEGSHHLSPTKFSGLPRFRKDRPAGSPSATRSREGPHTAPTAEQLQKSTTKRPCWRLRQSGPSSSPTRSHAGLPVLVLGASGLLLGSSHHCSVFSQVTVPLRPDGVKSLFSVI
ncbi:tesmin isoform X3 [Marmota monax]|uniref:tesmin isoform X3 n=1 Tax=Marmota monax TaxID=9995 RepID=UPI001EAFC8C6|nr:tesmin isoform X3 [Marmota monax]